MPRLGLALSPSISSTISSGFNGFVAPGAGGRFTAPGEFDISSYTPTPPNATSQPHSLVQIPTGLNLNFKYTPYVYSSSIRLFKNYPYITLVGPNGIGSWSDATFNKDTSINGFRSDNVTFTYELLDGDGYVYDYETIDLGSWTFAYRPDMGVYGRWVLSGKTTHDGSFNIISQWDQPNLQQTGDFIPLVGTTANLGESVKLVSAVSNPQKTQQRLLYNFQTPVVWSSLNQIFKTKNVSAYLQDNSTNSLVGRFDFTLPVPNGSASFSISPQSFYNNFKTQSILNQFYSYYQNMEGNTYILLNSNSQSLLFPLTGNGDATNLQCAGSQTSPNNFTLSANAVNAETQNFSATIPQNTSENLLSFSVTGTRSHNSSNFSVNVPLVSQLSTSHLVPLPSNFVSSNNSSPRDFGCIHSAMTLATNLWRGPGFAWWDSTKKHWWCRARGIAGDATETIRYSGGRYVFAGVDGIVGQNQSYGVSALCPPTTMPWMVEGGIGPLGFSNEFIKYSDLEKAPKILSASVSFNLNGVNQTRLLDSSLSTGIIGQYGPNTEFSTPYTRYAPYATQQIILTQSVSYSLDTWNTDLFYYDFNSRRWVYKRCNGGSGEEGRYTEVLAVWQSAQNITSLNSPISLSKIEGDGMYGSTATATISGGSLGSYYTISDITGRSNNLSVDSSFSSIW